MPRTFSTRRFWLLHFIVFSCFCVLLYQLFQLAWVRRSSLLQVASRQHVLMVHIPQARGEILDRSGKPLAVNLKVPSIYAVPRILPHHEQEVLVPRLAKILELEPRFLQERLSRDKAFVWLKRHVGPELTRDIEALPSEALGFLEEHRRFYPQGDLAAQVLGFADIDSRGLEGVELAMDDALRGRPGLRHTKRDAKGREIRVLEMKTIPPLDGHRVHLTLDQHIQYLTERALERAFLKWRAKGAWAIVMEAKTGKILAMANRPTFDPNRYAIAPVPYRRNRAVTDLYEPGSVFKLVTASAVLNEGAATPDTILDCENGEYRYSGSRTLHDVHPYGKIPFEEVIVKSSNIGTVKAAALLAPRVLQRYIEAFGFGKSTGFDLPGEAPGFTRPPSQWSKTSPYNIPIGHEIMVNALQVTAAMAAIANGGTLMKPYIISRVEDQRGITLLEKGPVEREVVLQPEIARVMRRILNRAVEEGTGKNARIEGIAVGGKTGTAQKVLPNGRGYSHDHFLASFSGFAPAEDPILVMTVVVDDPRPLYYGGTVAAPVFREVMGPALLSLGYIPKNAKEVMPQKFGEGLPENRPKLLPAEALGTRP